ncbi:MAG: tetratricopeptide repeat protein, partial [Gemmatimonadaceae bacterium]|nr:tetratricopeptide repeat protein [Gemmatimonadaceae bacterium]
MSLAPMLTAARPRATAYQGVAPDSALKTLIAQARAQPDSVRDALFQALGETVSTTSVRQRTAQLLRARRLAAAYAHAWNDSFFIRQVTRFESASRSHRRERVLAESLRRAGNAAMGEEGIPAAMNLWRQSLRRATSSGDPAAIAPALLSIGAGFYRFAQYDSAASYLNRAEALAVRIGDKRTAGNAVGILASVSQDRGDLSSAAQLYRRASAIRALSGDSRGIAADANNLGLIADQRGDSRGAIAAYERALSINRRDKRQGLVALNLSNLAGIATSIGEYSRAESLYRESLALHEKHGDRAEAAFVHHGLGKLYMNRGEYRQAEVALEKSLRIHTESGAVTDAVAVRVDMAAVKSATGEPEAARRTLQEASRIAKSAGGYPEVQGSLALARGRLAIQFGTFADADSEYSQSARQYRAAGHSAGLAQALEGKALLLHLRGDHAASLRVLGEVGQSQAARG